MKNSFKVANGTMTRSELAQELVKDLLLSSLLPSERWHRHLSKSLLSAMIGSFVGSAIGSCLYPRLQCGHELLRGPLFYHVRYRKTGLHAPKMFSVRWRRSVPVARSSPLDSSTAGVTPTTFNQALEPNSIGIQVLRRGVIEGPNRIYLSPRTSAEDTGDPLAEDNHSKKGTKAMSTESIRLR